MRSHPLSLAAIALACVLGKASPIDAEPAARTASLAGYALGAERCGANLSFPRLPIGMRAGYCAGLVASKSDGLVFPRNIVQVPGSNLFVIADMGVGWSPGRGRLLLLDPAAAEGKRIKV